MKQKFNYLRKIWHSLGLFIPVCYLFDLFKNIFPQNPESTKSMLLIISVTIFAFNFLLDIARLNSQLVQSFFVRFFSLIMKESEKQKFTAVTPYFLSCFVTILIFPKEIAILSILFLVIGDPVASFVGIKYGKIKLRNKKSLEGLLGFILVTFFLGYFMVSFNFENFSQILSNISFWSLIFILLFSSIIAGLTEFFCGNHLKGLIDDNLLIPISTGCSLYFFLLLFEKINLGN